MSEYLSCSRHTTPKASKVTKVKLLSSVASAVTFAEIKAVINMATGGVMIT